MPKSSIYFIGIGGIGMSALARWYAAQGWRVAGYDRVDSDLTRALKELGIEIGDELPANLAERPTEWTVVRTPAVALEHPICTWFLQRGVPMLKRSEVLGQLTAQRPTIAVAGTHGKTTTSALLAHILIHAGRSCDAFLGGLIAPFGDRTEPTNLLLSADRTQMPNDVGAGVDPAGAKADWTVVEADEFDRSFLTLFPQAAVITSVDADHMDIYGDGETMLAAFREFGGQVDGGGLFIHEDAARAMGLEGNGVATYGWEVELEEDRKCSAAGAGRGPTFGLADFEVVDGRTHFSVGLPSEAGLTGGIRQPIVSPMPGRHNAENVQAAALLASYAGVEPAEIAAAMACFPGVFRRFQVYALKSGHTVVNDYAHHPVEIRRTVEAAREQFPGRKLSGIFQPHLYSRTRDFAAEFGRALSALDRCCVAPIFPAREVPLKGVDSHLILENIAGIPAETSDVSTFLSLLEPMSEEVILVLGAGDIDRMIPDLISLLEGGSKR
jgi:UDP-N-acetylmuramate--alanine ligase